MPKSTFILTEDLHIQDPHDVFLSLFESSNDEIMLEGTVKEFLKRSVLMILGVIGMRLLFDSHLPGFVDVLVTIFVVITSVMFVHFFVKNFIPLLLSFRKLIIPVIAGVLLLGLMVLVF